MSDWERIQEVFLMTADAPAAEQPRLLESLCAHDPELRAEVESLLASDCDSGTIIAEAVQSEASLLLDLEPLAGKRVGAYRIVREIGRGGMGAVYLATRDDEVFQKRVAIKVVKPGMDTADVLNRFPAMSARFWPALNTPTLPGSSMAAAPTRDCLFLSWSMSRGSRSTCSAAAGL